MKITIIEREADDYGDGELFKLLLETSMHNPTAFSAGRGESEDNSLGRDLNFVYSIEGMLKNAYEAGKAGEEFEVVNQEATEDDY